MSEPSEPQTDIERAAALFHALSDPRRLRIVQLLAGGERCVCELTAAMGVAQPLLSFHLKELKNVGLLADRRQGRWAYYSLQPGAVSEALGLVTTLTTPDPATTTTCCGAAPAEPADERERNESDTCC